MKTIFKRFLTWNPHHSDGFTLVELIVVIAILAILAGIGVPAYSGYVTKANKSNDETLAAEVKNALLLAHYSGELEDGSSVVIYFDQNKPAECTGTASNAMVAAFGAGWQDLHLSYDGWELGVLSNGEMMGYVTGSTFDADSEAFTGMLEGVSVATGIMASLVDSGSWNPSDEMKAFFEEKGIEYAAGNGDTVANATVMFVADNMSKTLKGKEADFAEAWFNIGVENITIPSFDAIGDDISSAAAQFAFAEALASHVDNANPGITLFTDSTGAPCTYVDYLHQAKNSGEPSVLKNAMEAVIGDINTKRVDISNHAGVATAVFDYYGVEIVNGAPVFPESNENTKAYQDGMAFIAYMQGITEVTDSLLNDTDLSNPDYYTDGTMLDYVTNYVAMHEVASGKEDALVFYYNPESDDLVVCAPLDY